jgi:aspartate 1-decarboxylase
MKTFVSSKIHGIRVTDKAVRYHGSVSICPHLMRRANIQEYEQVHLVNLTNGERWITYAIPAESVGAFTLNGGGARRGEIGDEFVIMAYETTEHYVPARVVHTDDQNNIRREFDYIAGESGPREG